MLRNRSRITADRILLSLALLLLVCPSPAAGETRNVILMISDGAGYNAFSACSYYQHGRLGGQVYDSFPIRVGCSTWMLNTDGSPQGYDPQQAWREFDYVNSPPGEASELRYDQLALRH